MIRQTLSRVTGGFGERRAGTEHEFCPSDGLLGNLAVSSQRPDAGALAEIGLTFLSGSQRVPALEKNERSVFEYTYPI
jgi:hypothetical protein